MWDSYVSDFKVFNKLFEQQQPQPVTYVPKTKDDYNALRNLTKQQLLALGMKIWDNKNEKSLYLFPEKWYDTIPQGFTLYTINNERIKFDRRVHAKDQRFGALPYGMMI